MSEFFTPPDHVNFLAKKLCGNLGEMMDCAVAFLDKDGEGPAHPHSHELGHFFIVTKGEAFVDIEGERFILKENEAIYVKSFAEHKTGNNIDDTTVMIGISIKEHKSDERK